MKTYTGKTAEEALEIAAEEAGVSVNDLIYIVTDKTKGIFSKKIVVEVYGLPDVIKYADRLSIRYADKSYTK